MSQEIDQLTEKDIQKLVDNCHKLPCYNRDSQARKPLPLVALKIFIVIIFYAGLRVSECLNLRVADINFIYGIITIRESKGGWRPCKNSFIQMNKKTFKKRRVCLDSCKLCNGKGKIRKAEYTVLPMKIIAKIAEYVEDQDLTEHKLLFKSPSFDQPVGRHWIWDQCKLLDKICNLHYVEVLDNKIITGLNTHAFRKSLTKQMIETQNPKIVMKQMRWKDLKPMATYINPSMDTLRKARAAES